MEITKKIYLEPFKKCPGLLYFTLLHHLTHDTTAEEPISPEERLGISLHRLSRGDYYPTIGEMAGRGLTNVQCITQEMCKMIVSNIWSQFVNFPETVN